MKEKKNSNVKFVLKIIGSSVMTVDNPVEFHTQYAERTLNEFEKLSTRPSLGEKACIKGPEYILFEVQD